MNERPVARLGRAGPVTLLAILILALGTTASPLAAQDGTWTTATLHQARWPIAAAVAGSRALFAGSGSGGVDLYDSATGRWSVATLSQARFQVVGASVGAEALFAGGIADPRVIDFSRVSDVVDIYDSATDRWRTATLSEARTDLAATTVGTKVLFAGGIARPTEAARVAFSAAVDIYDSATGEWSTAALSQARATPAAATVGTKALFAGGWSTAQDFDVVDIYDSMTGEWTTARLAQARRVGATATVDSKALFASHSFGALDVVDIYDGATNQWTTAMLSRARGGPTATTVGTKVLFAGGFFGDEAVDIYDNATDRWTTAGLSQGRYISGATAVGGTALFAGAGLVDIYDSVTDRWSSAPLSQPRAGIVAASVGSTALFAGGTTGSGENWQALDTVDIYHAGRGQ